MAVAFGTLASSSNDGGAKALSTSTPPPSGYQAGDLLLLWVCNASGAGTYANADLTGWTRLINAPDPLGDITGALYWKIATASEANQAPNGASANTTVAGVMMRYTGANGIRTSASATATTAVTGPAAATAAPALTGVQTTDMVVDCWAYGDDASRSANIHGTLVYPSATTYPGWTQRHNFIVAPGVSAQYPAGMVIQDKTGATDLPQASAQYIGGWARMSVALTATPDAVITPGRFLPFFA